MSFAVVRGTPTSAQLQVDRLMKQAGVEAGKENIAQLYLHCMKANPDGVALIDCDSGAEVSNGTLLRTIARFARAATGRGARRTAIVMRNSVPQVALFYALIAIDAMPLMLHYTSTPEEIKYYLDLQEPQLVFCDATTLDIVVAGTRTASCGVTVVCSGDEARTHPDVIMLDQFCQNYPDDWRDFSAVEVPGSSVAHLSATSGSTGPPKVTCITHVAHLAQAYQLWNYTEDIPHARRAMLVSSPQWLTHNSLVVTAPLFRVSVLVTARDIETNNLARCIGAYKADWMICSPLVMTMTSASPATALHSLQVMMVAGAMPCSDVLDTLRSKAPGIFIQRAYGITEATGFVAIGTQRSVPDRAIGPISNIWEYKIEDDDGKELTNPHEVGELYVKNDIALVKSYYKNPELKVPLRDDGWLVTGDLVQQDKDGNLYFMGRKKFSLMYDHYEVLPEEVEAVIGSVRGVAASFVGLSPAGPAALLVPEPHVDTEQLKQHIRNKVEASLSRYKHLHGGIYLADSLRTTNTGKILRSACQEKLDTERRRHGGGEEKKLTIY